MVWLLPLAFQSLTISRSLLSTLKCLFVPSGAQSSEPSMIRILVAGGDCMLGRAVQLSFPIQSPGEEYIKDSCTAQHYLNLCLNHSSGQLSKQHTPDLAEIRKQNSNGGSYLWGDYRGLKISPAPDMKLLNLETAVTKSIDNDDVPHGKGINYHMHADNFENIVLSGFQAETHSSKEENDGKPVPPIVVNCANNHIMDYGRRAMEEETLPLFDSLRGDLFQPVGCGRNFTEASRPAVVSLKNNAVRAHVFGFASGCSGTPSDWWAEEARSGLVGLPSLHSARDVNSAMKIVKSVFEEAPSMPQDKGGLRIVAIHWGPNWAMKGETESAIAARREFARKLIDECDVDMIYGHSSHHARGIELYKGKLILYGTGDIINDYEGFENRGEEKYNRLGGLYIVDIDSTSGSLRQLRIVPMYMDRLALKRYTPSSLMWQPNERRLVRNPQKSSEFCTFINKLSHLDAGGSENALVLEHCESDTQIPGGPILRSQLFGVNSKSA